MPSPRPTYFTGTPSSCAMATQMPPLAVPSSFVRIMPVRPAVSLNVPPDQPVLPGGGVQHQQRLRRRPALPVDDLPQLSPARSSGSPCCGAVRRCRTAPHPRSGPSPPASESNSTAPGSAPSFWRTMSHPASAPAAQISSWSAAAAPERVRGAQQNLLPCDFSCWPACRWTWSCPRR